MAEILEQSYAGKKIHVITSDKMEDIDEHRPCFKVDVVPIMSQPVTANYDEHRVTISISYFPSLSTRGYSIREKLENMHDELDSLFTLNFILQADEGARKTSLIVSNKVYEDDPEHAHMTLSFDVDYNNRIPELNAYTDPGLTSLDDIDMMHFIHTLNQTFKKE